MGELSLSRLWVLMVTAFVDLVGFALVLPLLPIYADEMGASPSIIGILLAAFAFSQLITGPMWGRLSDRIGRRPVILAGQFLSAIAFLVFAAADSVWLLLLSRLAQGAGGGTLSANHAYVADSVQPEQRAEALGWITACTSAGVMVGPAIGSFSVRWGDHVPGLIAATFCLLNMFFAWRWLPESSKKTNRPPPVYRSLRHHIGEIVRHPSPPVHALIWIYAAGMLAFMAVSGLMSLYLADRFGITKETIGGFYVALGALSVVMRALILGRLVRWLGEVRVLRLGILALIVGLAATPLANGPIQFLLLMLFVPLGTSLLFPSTTSLISRHSRPDEIGQTHGVQQAFGGTSRLLAPIWAGFAYEHAGAATPFWIAAGIVLFTLLFSLRLHPGEAPRRSAPEVEVELPSSTG